jgi:hypothetical protein
MNKIFSLMLITFFLLSSCSMATPTPMDDAQIGTAAAMTVQAALASQPTPLSTPTQKLAPETPIAQITSTPNLVEARANFDDAINCRVGPGVNYDRVFQTKAGDSFKIVGFFPPNFWVISTTAGECWVPGEFTTPVGNTKAVPTVTLPPTPLGGAPDAPSFSKNGWEWFCDGAGQVEVKLSWNDNSNTEKGYRIYRNEELVTELAANSTYFTEVIAYPGGQGLLYRVEAFNESGTASASTVALFCDL